MKSLRTSSLRRKLTIAMLGATLIALGVACSGFFLYERASFRQSLKEELTALADTLGANTTAPLLFDDRKAAREILGGLKPEGHIVAAYLYSGDGNIFAEYHRSGAAPEKEQQEWRGDGTRFSDERATVQRTIYVNGERVGGLGIVSDLSEFRAKMREYEKISLVVLAVAVIATWFVSFPLIRRITEPILELASTAGRVTAERNYAVRATHRARATDEVGKLMVSFNQMLEGIQERDAALQAAKDDLELRVDARTNELQLEVNERKQAQGRLQASLKELEDLKLALDQHCIVVRTDARGTITFVNEKFCSVSKYSAEELVGQTHRIINSKHHPKEFFQDLWRTISSGKPWKGEIKNRAKDGSSYWVDTTIMPFCDELGRPQQYIAIRADITGLKQIEEELRRAKNVAERASRAKSEFLANMSHEIRTPLNGIIGMTDLALDTELTAEQREYLQTVKTSSDSLLTVINDILDFSKIEAGKIDLEAVDFDLRDHLEATLRTLALRAEERKVELLCDIAPEVPEQVRCDSTRLRQVVLNLLGNAIKFTERGEVALKVRVEREEERTLLLRITVSDTGIGIPEDKRELIFAPFAQADTSTTRKYGGTGLGLTICTRLVRMMGGKIWVESEVGRGSDFHFTMRVAPVTSQNRPVKDGSESLRGVRVLIVDDNATNRRILERMLAKWEMVPVSAASGREALVELKEHARRGQAFGLIVTDMHMPEMDGFEFVERVRQNAAMRAATIMMLSSGGYRRDTERCRQLGVALFLLKPVRQSELREAITRAMGGRGTATVPGGLAKAAGEHGATEAMEILVAEDNAVNQRLILRLLEKRGHRVTLASNGLEACGAFNKGAFDLVLMDVQMPEMDGLEATSALREMQKASGVRVPIVALTAHAMKGDQEKCLAAGMDDYMTKPIQPQELDEILERYATHSIAKT